MPGLPKPRGPVGPSDDIVPPGERGPWGPPRGPDGSYRIPVPGDAPGQMPPPPGPEQPSPERRYECSGWIF